MLPQPLRAVLVGVALSLAGGAVIPAQQPSGVVATTLRAEYLVDPLALDVHMPRLSWIIDAPPHAVSHKRRIRSSWRAAPPLWRPTRRSLGHGQGRHQPTNQIEYGGRPLQSRQRAIGKSASGTSLAHRPRGAGPRVGKWDCWTSPTGRRVDRRPTPSVTTSPRRCCAPFALAARPATRPSCTRPRSACTKLRINGQRVGDHVLAPEFTDYRRGRSTRRTTSRRCFAPATTSSRHWLGDGWYAGGIGLAQALIGESRATSTAITRVCSSSSRSRRRLARRLNASSPTASWRVTRDGPIRSSDILNGESLRRAHARCRAGTHVGIRRPSWSAWPTSHPDVATQLVAQPNEPIRVTQEMKPVAVTRAEAGRVRLRPWPEHGGLVPAHRARRRGHDGHAHATPKCWTMTARSTPTICAARSRRDTLHASRRRDERSVRAALHLPRLPLRGGDRRSPTRPRLEDLVGRAVQFGRSRAPAPSSRPSPLISTSCGRTSSGRSATT